MRRRAAGPAGWLTSTLGTIGLASMLVILATGIHQANVERNRDRNLDCVFLLRSQVGPVFALAWSPDGKSLAVSGFGPIVRLWDPESGRVASIEGGTEQPRFALGWSEDGRRLVMGGLDVPIESWDLDSGPRGEGDRVLRPPDVPGCLQVLAGSTRGGGMRVWGAIDGRSRLLPDSGVQANSAAFSPDGRTIATSNNDCAFRVWDARSGRHRWTYRGDFRGITRVAFSPDGSKLAAAGGGPVRLWDVASGAPLSSLGPTSGGSANVVFSPDGRRLAYASWDGSIRVCDIPTGVEQWKFLGHVGQILSLAWSPDGKTLASGGYDATVRLWDVAGPIAIARAE